MAGAPSITKAELEHWVSVTDGFEASGAKVNGRSIPKPPVPQPPDYKACIAGIHRSFGGSAKAQCEREYVQLERKALSYLITTDWIRGEAARRHLSVSHSEVAAHLHSELKGKYRPGSSQFKSMISYTGESMGDLAQRTEGELLKDKIAQTLLAHKARTTEASLLLISFQESFQARWKPRTSCRPGYVIEDCSQFTAQSLAAPGQKQTTTYGGESDEKIEVEREAEVNAKKLARGEKITSKPPKETQQEIQTYHQELKEKKQLERKGKKTKKSSPKAKRSRPNRDNAIQSGTNCRAARKLTLSAA